MRWYVKVRRYANPEATSVIAILNSLMDANEVAADYNHRYQTDACYVEEYDAAQAGTWTR